jgi:hypothetical protein
MQGHQRNASSRVRLGTLIVGIALSLMSFGMAPAQAAKAGPTAAVSAVTASQRPVQVSAGRPCGQAAHPRVAPRCAGSGTQQFSEGGCGFLQRCIYLNRTEQTYLVTGSKWVVQYALCSASLGLGCAFAGLLVELAAQWINDHGGICPTSKPKLRVQYFPNPAVEGCVA